MVSDLGSSQSAEDKSIPSGQGRPGRRTPWGPLVILSGPSGVGKTTLVDRLIGESPLPLRRAVTATTRPPRLGERPEIDYHFWTEDQFQAAIARQEMLEFAKVHGRDWYGTPRSEVDPYRTQGFGVILVIDVQGAEQVRRLYPGDHLSIFLLPPSFDDLQKRLKQRGESDESIARRLSTARVEMTRANEFDYQLINDDITQAIGTIEGIIHKQFPQGVNDHV
jgi:guanylate kinase